MRVEVTVYEDDRIGSCEIQAHSPCERLFFLNKAFKNSSFILFYSLFFEFHTNNSNLQHVIQFVSVKAVGLIYTRVSNGSNLIPHLSTTGAASALTFKNSQHFTGVMMTQNSRVWSKYERWMM